MQVHASNLRPGGTENELYLEFPFYKDKESTTITKMILTFTDLIYAEKKIMVGIYILILLTINIIFHLDISQKMIYLCHLI